MRKRKKKDKAMPCRCFVGEYNSIIYNKKCVKMIQWQHRLKLNKVIKLKFNLKYKYIVVFFFRNID